MRELGEVENGIELIELRHNHSIGLVIKVFEVRMNNCMVAFLLKKVFVREDSLFEKFQTILSWCKNQSRVQLVVVPKNFS